VIGKPKIIIVLGTYNGSRFLTEQLHSFQKQEWTDWLLLVRDDGSTDGTVEILNEFESSDARIRCLRDQCGRLGVIGNYAALMQAALTAAPDFAFYSDQDDVWLPTKLSDGIFRLQECETVYGKIPFLIHSDLVVVSENLHMIHPSFIRYQGIAHELQSPLTVLLAQNFVTGCTIGMNRSLLEVVVPVPKHVIMHDWWAALCAAACGQIAYLSTPSVLYRQHGRNEIGAQGTWNLLNPVRTNWYGRWKVGTQTFRQTTVQAAELHQRIVERYGKGAGQALFLSKNYAACLHNPRFKRLAMLYHARIHPQGPLRQLLFWLRVMLLSSPAVHSRPHAGSLISS
jgi:rhamnosyltransferase